MPANPLDFERATILVTGASAGIGRETAILLSELNARIIVTGRSRDRLQKTLECLVGADHRLECYDLDNVDDIPRWMKALTVDSRPLAGIAHLAGVYDGSPIRIMSGRKLDAMFRTNVSTAAMLARAFQQKDCHTPGGSVVFTSSIAGLVGQPGVSVYGATKAAIVALTRALAAELAGQRIRVNCVAPGLVRSEMSDMLLSRLTPESRAALESAHPLGFGSPRDVAYGIAYLLAPVSKWVTGTTLVIDGGYTAQ